MSESRLRPGRVDDVAAIAAFTTDTFSWGDYVAESLPEWLDDEETEVVVATGDDDRPVALARVRMLGPREGWISAARVHPDHRRRGLGSALNHWCVDWIAGRGGAVARLQIEAWNEAAHNQVVAIGYRPVATVANAVRAISASRMEPATNGGRRAKADERLDRAPHTEAEGAFIAWSTSELARAAHGLFPVDRWSWRRMAPDDTHLGQTWSCPSGWVLAEDEEGELTVRWLVANPDDASLLVRATVDLAHERQAEGIHLIVPAVDWLLAAVEGNGFETHPTRIYEKPISR
ncbi:MAG TPA: GNAT family N-acetyltransferase [Acidimicrobiia bacterium]|nr:GNAT family N-acetyltransferase [Acidimicrobiia bacterium]